MIDAASTLLDDVINDGFTLFTNLIGSFIKGYFIVCVCVYLHFWGVGMSTKGYEYNHTHYPGGGTLEATLL